MASIHDVLKSKKARLDTSLEALDATSAKVSRTVRAATHGH